MRRSLARLSNKFRGNLHQDRDNHSNERWICSVHIHEASGLKLPPNEPIYCKFNKKGVTSGASQRTRIILSPEHHHHNHSVITWNETLSIICSMKRIINNVDAEDTPIFAPKLCYLQVVQIDSQSKRTQRWEGCFDARDGIDAAQSRRLILRPLKYFNHYLTNESVSNSYRNSNDNDDDNDSVDNDDYECRRMDINESPSIYITFQTSQLAPRDEGVSRIHRRHCNGLFQDHDNEYGIDDETTSPSPSPIRRLSKSRSISSYVHFIRDGEQSNAIEPTTTIPGSHISLSRNSIEDDSDTHNLRTAEIERRRQERFDEFKQNFKKSNRIIELCAPVQLSKITDSEMDHRSSFDAQSKQQSRIVASVAVSSASSKVNSWKPLNVDDFNDVYVNPQTKAESHRMIDQVRQQNSGARFNRRQLISSCFKRCLGRS